MLPLYLARKEILRSRVRFASLIVIVALITMLVLFLAAMGDGLALGLKQYIEQINADLIAYHADAELSIPASRLDRTRLKQIGNVSGVAAVGPIGLSSASILAPSSNNAGKIDIALIGVEPSLPGSPAVFAGRELSQRQAREAVIDQNLLNNVDIPLGSTLTVKVVQGTEDQRYDLTVIGFTNGQKYNFQPGVFVPLPVWDRIRPQGHPEGTQDLLFDIVAVKLHDPTTQQEMIRVIERQVPRVKLVDKITAYESIQGYDAMQSTTNAQQNFMLLIVLLIIGGFFQIQTLQKTAQIGMLRAIGATNGLVIRTLLAQVMLTTVSGLLLGGLVVWLLAPFIPPSVPLVFETRKMLIAASTLLAVGPIAGTIAVYTALKVEPLTALGLGT